MGELGKATITLEVKTPTPGPEVKTPGVPDSYPFRSSDLVGIYPHEGLVEIVFVAKPADDIRVLTLTVEAAAELCRRLGVAA